MALRKRGKWWYGDSQADIREALGRLKEYVPTEFADAQCVCGGRIFQLRLDEDAGAAVRICVQPNCRQVHPIGDSDQYLEDAELQERVCVCGEEEFEITVGVHLYSGSQDVKWLYVGCRCPSCGVTGNYGDWKNEFIDYRRLLARV